MGYYTCGCLTRYIHLNPVRGGLLRRLSALRRYPWTGHAAILGRVDRDWQDTATVLAYFGRGQRRALQRYEAFVREGLAQGRRPELVGGGLLRSQGGWAQVLSLRRKGSPGAADARILGSGAFVERLLAEAAHRDKETLRLSRKVVDLAVLEGGLVLLDINTATLFSRFVVSLSNHERPHFDKLSANGWVR